VKCTRRSINTSPIVYKYSFTFDISLCKLRDPFTAVVAGPTLCGKTAWFLKLVRNASHMIYPSPLRIYYCYKEYQSIFDDYYSVIFCEGLPEMTDDVFDGKQPTLSIIDDLMSKTNQLVADIFTKISHHGNISVIYMTQNVFDKNKFARNISLNAYYLVLFKNHRDANQFAMLSRQMYPDSWRFAVQAYRDATSSPFSYLLENLRLDLKDEQCRLWTNIFRVKIDMFT